MTYDPNVTYPPPTQPVVTPPYFPDARVRWGLWDFAIGIAVFCGLLVVASVAISIPGIRALLVPQAQLVNFLGAAAAYAALFAVIVVASQRRGLRSLAADFGLRFRPIDIAIGIGVGIGMRLFTVGLTLITIGLTGYRPEHGNFILPAEPLWIALNGVLIGVIVAPIVEELFFRGLLMRSVRNRVLRSKGRTQPVSSGIQRLAVRISVLVSAGAFMLLHLYQADNLTFAIILAGSTFTVGLVNALVAARTGRLGGGIIAHIFFNGSAVLLAIAASGAGA